MVLVKEEKTLSKGFTKYLFQKHNTVILYTLVALYI